MRIFFIQFVSILTVVASLINPFISQAQQKTGSVCGAVETSDHKPLAFATIMLKDTRYGIMADDNGKFCFKAPVGDYTLAVTYAGYIAIEKKITVLTNEETKVETIIVNAGSNQLREVVVADIQRNKFANKQSSTAARMPLADLENPQVYSVVRKELIQELSAIDFNSALVSIPGVVVTNGINDNGNDLTLRGFRSQAVFRNGLATDSRTQTDISNVERIEVLKGPSGTLFGGVMSTYGGVVNTITKKPFESFRGEVSYTTGSWGLNRFTADINTPLNKDRSALLRLNAAGHVQNSFQDAGFLRSTSFAASMLFKTSERTTVRFDADVYVPTKNLNAYIRSSDLLTVSSMKDVNLNPDRSFTSDDIGVTRSTINAMAEIEHKISDKWTSRSSYQHSESGEKESIFFVPYFIDDSHIQRRFRIFENYQLTVDNLQQNFTGDFKIGTVRNRVVIGADYFSRTINNQSMNPVFQIYDVVTLDDNIAWEPISKSKIQDIRSAANTKSTNDRTSSYTLSAYASDVVNITDRLLAMASLRVDYFERKNSLSGGVSQKDAFDQVQLSPKFGLVFQPIIDQISLFTNYQNGFTNVAPTTDAVTGELTQWKPEQAFQFEAGVKFELFNGTLNSTISYYDIKVKDKVRSLDDVTSVQDGDQYSKGLEIDVIANPVPGFNIVAGYGYNDNKYTQYEANYNDKRMPWTPKHVANLWISYKLLDGKTKGLGAGIGANYAGNTYMEISNKFSVPAYTIFGASVFFDQPKYRIGLKVNNFMNERYWNFYGQPQKPREVLGSISYKF